MSNPGGAFASSAEAFARSAPAIMVVEYVFRYPLVRPAAEAAGYGRQARLRGLHRAMPDDVLNNHDCLNDCALV